MRIALRSRRPVHFGGIRAGWDRIDGKCTDRRARPNWFGRAGGSRGTGIVAAASDSALGATPLYGLDLLRSSRGLRVAPDIPTIRVSHDRSTVRFTISAPGVNPGYFVPSATLLIDLDQNQATGCGCLDGGYDANVKTTHPQFVRWEGTWRSRGRWFRRTPAGSGRLRYPNPASTGPLPRLQGDRQWQA